MTEAVDSYDRIVIQGKKFLGIGIRVRQRGPFDTVKIFLLPQDRRLAITIAFLKRFGHNVHHIRMGDPGSRGSGHRLTRFISAGFFHKYRDKFIFYLLRNIVRDRRDLDFHTAFPDNRIAIFIRGIRRPPDSTFKPAHKPIHHRQSSKIVRDPFLKKIHGLNNGRQIIPAGCINKRHMPAQRGTDLHDLHRCLDIFNKDQCLDDPAGLSVFERNIF